MATKSNTKTLATLTDAERKRLAQAIVKARQNGRPWDGPEGIVNSKDFPQIKSAITGRKLLRAVERGDMIQKSYDRAAKGLTGKRDAKKAPAKKRTTTKKVAPKATTRKRTTSK